MVKTLLLISFCLNIHCRTTSKINFENKILEKEVQEFVQDLKKSKLEILSILIESHTDQDSVFITISNAYPDITKVKIYAGYRGLYFCFGGEYPLAGYYSVLNPDSVPAKLKTAYEDARAGKQPGAYEPFTKSLTFYKGRLVKSEMYNEE